MLQKRATGAVPGPTWRIIKPRLADTKKCRVLKEHYSTDCSVIREARAREQAELLSGEFNDLNPKSEEVIKINASGVRIETSRRVLCIFPESKLAALFSGAWELRYDKDGWVFLACDGHALDFIVQQISSGLDESMQIAKPSKEMLQSVKKALLFWGLSNCITLGPSSTCEDDSGAPMSQHELVNLITIANSSPKGSLCLPGANLQGRDFSGTVLYRDESGPFFLGMRI